MILDYFGQTPFEIVSNIVVRLISIAALLLLIRVLMVLKDPIEARPWKIMLLALITFMLKKMSISLSQYGILYIPSSFFNTVVVSLFIFALLSEIEHCKKK